MKSIFITLIMILISTGIFAQDIADVYENQDIYWSKEKIGLYASTMIYSIGGGLLDGWQYKEGTLSGAEALEYNKLWHRVKPVRAIGAIGIGGTIALDSKAWKAFNSWKDFGNSTAITASNLVLVSSIHWILFDHFNYVGMGADVPFLQTSDWAKKNNGIISDAIASPTFKITYLIFAIIQNYLITMWVH